MGKHRILIVDDDHDILDLLTYNLEREGFKVQTLDSGTDAVATCVEFEPDLIILDIMMPGVNGIEVCKKIRSLRKFSETFIFFLTARSESYFQEAALDTGGDDFIEKIIGLRTLTSKVRAVLKRRLIIRKREAIVEVGDLRVNRRAGSAKIAGKEIMLSKPEFELLFFFAQNPNKILTSENLLGNIWGSETFSAGVSLEVYMDLLMRKLGGQWLSRLPDGRYTLAMR